MTLARLTVSGRREAEAAFSAPLKGFVNVDAEGFASFSYAGQCGALQAVLSHIVDGLRDADCARGKEKSEKLKNALAHAERAYSGLLARSDAWDEYVDKHGLLTDAVLALKGIAP